MKWKKYIYKSFPQHNFNYAMNWAARKLRAWTTLGCLFMFNIWFAGTNRQTALLCAELIWSRGQPGKPVFCNFFLKVSVPFVPGQEMCRIDGEKISITGVFTGFGIDWFGGLAWPTIALWPHWMCNINCPEDKVHSLQRRVPVTTNFSQRSAPARANLQIWQSA